MLDVNNDEEYRDRVSNYMFDDNYQFDNYQRFFQFDFQQQYTFVEYQNFRNSYRYENYQNRVYSQQQSYQQQFYQKYQRISYEQNQFSNDQSSSRILFAIFVMKQITIEFDNESKNASKKYVLNHQQFKFVKSRIYYENDIDSTNEYEKNEYYEDKSINETTKQHFVYNNNYY